LLKVPREPEILEVLKEDGEVRVTRVGRPTAQNRHRPSGAGVLVGHLILASESLPGEASGGCTASKTEFSCRRIVVQHLAQFEGQFPVIANREEETVRVINDLWHTSARAGHNGTANRHGLKNDNSLWLVWRTEHKCGGTGHQIQSRAMVNLPDEFHAGLEPKGHNKFVQLSRLWAVTGNQQLVVPKV